MNITIRKAFKIWMEILYKSLKLLSILQYFNIKVYFSLDIEILRIFFRIHDPTKFPEKNRSRRYRSALFYQTK